MGFLGVTLWGNATGKGTWGCLQIESHPFRWPLSVPISSSFPTGSTPYPPASQISTIPLLGGPMLLTCPCHWCRVMSQCRLLSGGGALSQLLFLHHLPSCLASLYVLGRGGSWPCCTAQPPKAQLCVLLHSDLC